VDLKRAREIMVPLDRYPWVTPNFALGAAIEMIEDSLYDIQCANGRHSLPRVLLVIDPKDGLVGLLRRRDILRGLHPTLSWSAPAGAGRGAYVVPTDPNLSELSFDHLLRRMRSHACRTVREVMQPVETTVMADDHVFKVIAEMVSRNVSLIPVLDAGDVIGAVRTVDVLHEVARMLGGEEYEACRP
jgi:CBS-domain-containing membrane protein